MHPMGWDAFGLPAEQHAKRTGAHPRTTTEKNIANFRRQLKMLGFSYDWRARAGHHRLGIFPLDAVHLPGAVRHLVRRGPAAWPPAGRAAHSRRSRAAGEAAVEQYRNDRRLAYQLEAAVNWCPALGTVLANEEVQGGLSERGGHPVVRLPLRQWMLRITAYAERLEKDLAGLDWPESIKLLQRNWIGRSTGAEVDFFIGSQRRRW